MVILSSCYYFGPFSRFERHVKSENRHIVIFYKANDGSGKITTVIENPDSTKVRFQGTDITKYLDEGERRGAVYAYIGNWEESEKKYQNYHEEFPKWSYE